MALDLLVGIHCFLLGESSDVSKKYLHGFYLLLAKQEGKIILIIIKIHIHFGKN